MTTLFYAVTKTVADRLMKAGVETDDLTVTVEGLTVSFSYKDQQATAEFESEEQLGNGRKRWRVIDKAILAAVNISEVMDDDDDWRTIAAPEQLDEEEEDDDGWKFSDNYDNAYEGHEEGERFTEREVERMSEEEKIVKLSSSLAVIAFGVSLENLTTLDQTEEAMQAVKKKYRELSVKYHPDRGGDEEIMKHVRRHMNSLSETIGELEAEILEEDDDGWKNY